LRGKNPFLKMKAWKKRIFKNGKTSLEKTQFLKTRIGRIRFSKMEEVSRRAQRKNPQIAT